MGRPGKQCRGCTRPGQFCVQNCDNCNGSCCVKHILWHSDEERWLCTKCAKKAVVKTEEKATT